MTLEMVIKDIADTVKLSFDSALKTISEKYESRIKDLEAKLGALPLPEKGEKGDSVTVEDIKPLVIEAVASIEIPTPKDGKDYDPDELVKAVNESVERAISAIPLPENGKDADIEEINKYILEEIAKIPAPQDGKSITKEDVAPLIKTFVEEAVALIPVPKDGINGKDAEPINYEEISGTILSEVESNFEKVNTRVDEYLKNIPVPKDGVAGLDGKDGISPSAEDVAKAMEATFAKWAIDFERQANGVLERAIERMPKPKDGVDGKDGIDGKNGIDGKDGEKGQDGVDGIDGIDGVDGKNGTDGIDGKDGISPSAEDVAKAMEATFAKWAIDFERQANGVLERAIERMPKPKDGRDGIEIKDFDISLGDDLRTVTVSLKSGDTIIEKNIIIPSLIDRGVFSESKEYSLGDGVTYAGSFWIAQKNTPEGKPSASQDWRLAVKKGKDAKEVVRLPKPTTVKVGV